jgi:V/A-type H+/Na+-transporting ATPase subunit E
MSLETILNAIETSGELELAQLEQETEARVQQILAEAEQKAALRQDLARQTAVSPAAGERARRLHQARLEALRIVAMSRDQLVASVLEQTRRRLTKLRHEPIYARVLRELIEEAIRVLGDEEINSKTAGSSQPWLEIDARDERLVREILPDLDLDLVIRTTLDCWGGVAVYSGDGRIIVTNTLETRLERATPYLRQELATFFEALNAPAIQEAVVT